MTCLKHVDIVGPLFGCNDEGRKFTLERNHAERRLAPLS